DIIRIKTNGNLLDGLAGSGINLTGTDILLEAGDGGIGEAGRPLTANMTGTAGGLIARATADVRITAPQSDLRLESVYSKSGDAYLEATVGSILDALDSSATKVQAGFISLKAGGGIGTELDPLEIDATGLHDADATSAAGTVLASAGGTIVLTETHGDFNVQHVESTGGDVVLVAAEGS